VPAEWLGSKPSYDPPPPPRLLVFPKYVAGSTTRWWPITPAEAVREMAQLTFDFPRHAACNLGTLAAVAAGATAVQLRIGSLEQAVLAIETIVGQILLEEM
jgi:hypothetical protein